MTSAIEEYGERVREAAAKVVIDFEVAGETDEEMNECIVRDLSIAAAIRALPLPAPAEVSAWQDIATWTGDYGDGVIAWDHGPDPYTASWTKWGWFDGVVYRSPTHWQPWPAPPLAPEREA